MGSRGFNQRDFATKKLLINRFFLLFVIIIYFCILTNQVKWNSDK